MIWVNTNKRRKDIVSVEAYLSQTSYIRNIINWCNLQPVGSWREWQDGSGYFLSVSDNKKITVLQKKVTEPSTNDILHKAPLSSILRLSKKMIVSIFNSHKTYWALGNDNILRLVVKENNIDTNHCPLFYYSVSLCSVVKNLVEIESGDVDITYPYMKSKDTGPQKSIVMNAPFEEI